MRSKPFIFLAFIFILCLIIVGWYFSETYVNKAPVAAYKGLEYPGQEQFNFSKGYQDFFAWLKTKVAIGENYFRKSSMEPVK